MFVCKEVMSNDTINGSVSDVVGKRVRILGVAIFIFNISFKNVSYVFVKSVQQGTILAKWLSVRLRIKCL